MTDDTDGTGEPTVDVVLATNRESPFLHEALASVRAQTHTRWRLILVDDGIPSGTFVDGIRADFPEVTVLRSLGTGISAARNAGLSGASAPWVTFLDDDDVWAPERLAAMVSAVGRMPTAVGAFCGGWYMDDAGVAFGNGWPASPTASRDFLRGAVPLPRIVTLMVARQAALAIGAFDTQLWMGEDIDFTLRLLQSGELAAVQDQLVGYRRHDDNVTNAPLPTQHRITEGVITEAIEAARARGERDTAALLGENLARYRRGAARDSLRRSLHHLRQGRPVLAVSDVWWSVTRAPGAVFAGAGARAASRLRPADRPRD